MSYSLSFQTQTISWAVFGMGPEKLTSLGANRLTKKKSLTVGDMSLNT